MQTKTNNQVYAGFFVLLAAYIIDWLVVGIALLAVKVPIWISSLANPNNLLVRDFIFKYSIVDIVIYVLTATYFILPTYYAGRTLGKRLLQLKVISVEDRPMTFFEVVYRETVGKFLSGILLGVGYLMIVIDRQKRGIHDLLADTKVIYYHEKKEPVQTPIVYQPVQRPIIYPENQKNYYRNADMNPQSMQNQPGNPMVNPQGMQSQPGNSMANPQNMQGQPGNPMANPQNMQSRSENPMANSQNMQSQPENSMVNPQNMQSQPGNLIENPQNSQNQPVHSQEKNSLQQQPMQQAIYEQPGFRQAPTPVPKPSEPSSRDSEI